jgi:hypothetical protein
MITKYQIECFYNRDREPDVKYTFFDKIPVTLQQLIKEILIYKLKNK